MNSRSSIIVLMLAVILVGVVTFIPAAWRDNLTLPIATALNDSIVGVTHPVDNAQETRPNTEIVQYVVSKIGHILVFFALGIVLATHRGRFRFFTLVVVILFFSVASELMQNFTNGRTPGWIDVGIDAISGLLAVVGVFTIRYLFAQKKSTRGI